MVGVCHERGLNMRPSLFLLGATATWQYVYIYINGFELFVFPTTPSQNLRQGRYEIVFSFFQATKLST
jgi:hypothetical protein